MSIMFDRVMKLQFIDQLSQTPGPCFNNMIPAHEWSLIALNATDSIHTIAVALATYHTLDILYYIKQFDNNM